MSKWERVREKHSLCRSRSPLLFLQLKLWSITCHKLKHFPFINYNKISRMKSSIKGGQPVGIFCLIWWSFTSWNLISFSPGNSHLLGAFIPPGSAPRIIIFNTSPIQVLDLYWVTKQHTDYPCLDCTCRYSQVMEGKVVVVNWFTLSSSVEAWPLWREHLCTIYKAGQRLRRFQLQ